MTDTAFKSARADLGLDAASDGDPKGMRRFLDFVHRELWSLAVIPELPEPIRTRITSVSRDAASAVEFLDGYIAAKATKER